MLNKKRILSIIMVFVMSSILIFTGCTQQEEKPSNDNNDKAPTEKVSDDKASEKKVTLTMWTNWTETDMHYPATSLMFDKYRNDNPNVDFVVEEMPIDMLRSKLSTAMAASSAPDILHIPGNIFQESGDVAPGLWARNGLLLDLTPYLNEDQAWKDSINPDSLVPCTQDGKVYAVPIEYSASYNIYNKELLEKTGMSYPETWEDVMALSKKLKEMGAVYTVLGGNGPWLTNSILLPLLEGTGARADWDKAIIGEGTFMTSEIIEAFNMFNEFIHNGGINPKEYELTNDEAMSEFFNGNGFMLMDGEWMYGWIKDNGADINLYDKIDLGLIPSVKGTGQMFTYNVFTTEAINADIADDEDKLDAAIKYLKTITSKESAVAFAEKAEASIGTMFDPEKDASGLSPIMKKNYSLYNEAEKTYSPQGASLAWDALSKATVLLEMGESVEVVLEQMEEEVRDLKELRK